MGGVNRDGGNGRGDGSGTQDGGEPDKGVATVPAEGPEVRADVLADARGGSDGVAAESERIASLIAEVAGLRRELADAKSAAEKAGLRAEIERALGESGAIDLEITTPLVEEVMGSMETPDVGKAVREVRASKGFLFRGPAGSGGMGSGGVGGKGSVMAGVSPGRGVGLEDLAGDARSTGDRSDLLRYLRARRG